ncbi:MAG TPA: AMP-binding protein [Thermodesulfovibrionales bacterium]|nr:AMP-binding protein [Thermodesulfovibrionales bacterium]
MHADTIISLFLASAERYRDKSAFTYFDDSWKKVTYREILEWTGAVASYLIQAGVKNGDRVALVSENRVEWCAAYLAILLSGGVAVPIDAQLGAAEIGNLLTDSSAVLVFHSGKTAPAIGGVNRAVNFDSALFREILATPGREPCPPHTEEDLASIVYTSGTTGTPKGVMLTHRNFCSDARSLIGLNIVGHTDVVLSILPLHHTYAFMCTFLVPLFLGATITYPPGIKAPELMTTMKEQGVTVLVAVPQLLELMRNGILRRFHELPAPLPFLLRALFRFSGKLRKHTVLNPGKLIFRSVHRAFGDRFRFFACGGARLDPPVMEDLEALGFTVLEGYGLTETSPVVTFNPPEKRKPGSAGRALSSAEIRILNPLKTKEGEIAIRGPMVMKGYYRNPGATAEVLHEGWFLSGDLGYLDDEGYLFITGRLKEVIVLSSGKNVYPEDVEKEYLRIPLVQEICVTGGEEKGVTASLHAVIVPDLDYARKEKIGNLHDALRWEIQRLSATLPPYMRLKGFTLSSDPLPRTPLGKLKRHLVKDVLKQQKAPVRGQREEDRALRDDGTGRIIVECLTPLLKEDLPIHLSDDLELDLGLDSLQRIELVVAIEKAFSLKLPETFASEVHSVEELILKIKDIASTNVPPSERPPAEDILSADVSGEEKKRVGLESSAIEWTVVVLLLKAIRCILKVFFRFETKGLGNLPEPPFIIAANHSSNMDGFVVAGAVPSAVFRVLFFQGFRTYFSGWWLPSLFGRLGHAIPIDPETFLSGALRLSSHVLKTRRILCIFPEGGRSFDGELMPFKKGIGILAVRHNVPVVPALIEGTFTALPKGALFPRPSRVRITFGKPFHPSELDISRRPGGIDEYRFFADEVRERIKGLVSDGDQDAVAD